MIQPILSEKTLRRLQQLINSVKSVAITCHLSPDGDAVGSALALCHVMRRLGKDAIVVTPDMVPKSLNFLPGVKGIVTFSQSDKRTRDIMSSAQIIFCLDFNSMRRIDKLASIIMSSPARKVLIDHHSDPEQDFELMISFPEMSSTCELVYRVLMELQLLRFVDRFAAQCLLTGMMTDTGNFSYNCENPEIYEIQASLMRRHPERQWLYNKAMNTFSLDCLRLKGYAIDKKLRVFPEFGAALIALTADELKRYNYKRGDTEGLVNMPLAIPGVQWCVFLREDAEYIKVSCRSVGDFRVNDICAKHFNGGGHANAAGGEFYGTLDEAVDVCEKIFRKMPPSQVGEPNNEPINNEKNNDE